MKKFSMLLGIIMATTMICIGCAGAKPAAPGTSPQSQYPQEIKIGFVRPATGDFASYGERLSAGFQLAVDQINALGGIKNLGGAKLVADYGDDAGSPDQATTEATRLITQDKIALIVGTWPTCMAIGTVSQSNKIPYLNPYTIAPITAVGNKYAFSIHATAKQESGVTLTGMLMAAKEAGLPPPKTVWMQYVQDDDCSISDAEQFKPQAEAAGLTIIGEDKVASTQSTFVPQLLKMEQAKPDVLYNLHDTPDAIIMYKEMMERGTYIPYGVFSWGGGTADPAFYDALPLKAYNYGFMVEDGDGMPQKRPWYNYYNTNFEAMTGDSWISGQDVVGLMSVWVVKDALERVQYSPDLATFRDNLRDAMAATDINRQTGEQVTLPDGTTYIPALDVGDYQQIKFDANGQNITPISSSVRTSMGPAGRCTPRRSPALRPVVLPIPQWDAR